MTIAEILEIKDEDVRMNEFRNFNDKRSMTPYQKMMFATRLTKESYIIEFFSDDLCFDVSAFTYVLIGDFSEELKEKIAHAPEYKWLREKVSNSNLSVDNIREIIYAYDGSKRAFNLLNRNMPYYKEHENFILRNTTSSYDEKTIDALLQMEKIDQAEITAIKSRLKDLFDVNDEILQDVNFNILTDKYRRLGKKLTVITRYPAIQERILELNNKELAFLCDSIDFLNNRKIDWIPLVDDLLANIKEYSGIINNDIEFGIFMRALKGNNSRLQQEGFMKVLTVMTDKNKYQFDSFRDITNSSRGNRIANIQDKDFFKLADVDKIRALIFEKIFGQDFKTAKRFFEYYAQDYENAIKAANWNEQDIEDYLTSKEGLRPGTPEYEDRAEEIRTTNSMVGNYLRLSHEAFKDDDIERLLQLYAVAQSNEEVNIPKSIMDSSFRAFYARLMNQKLYVPKESDKIRINGTNAYLMPDDCYFLLSSTDCYAKGNNGQTIVQDWNSKKIKNHVICTAFAGGKNISLPPMNGVCYGFAPIDPRSLLKSAPYDTGVWPIAREFDVYKSEAKYAFGAKFLTPEVQLKQTMRRHNEVDIERESYDYENSSVFKLQPSYTITTVDLPLSAYLKRDLANNEVLNADLLKRLIDDKKMNDLLYRSKIIEKQLSKDQRWKKTLVDSAKKGLKNTIEDMTHTLIKQRLEIDKKQEKLLSFSESDLNNPNNMKKFLNLMEEVVVDFDAARASVIQKEIKGWNDDGASVYGDLLHKELYEKLFSTRIMDEMLWKIEEKFKKFNPRNYRICMRKMQEISKMQVDKLDKQYWWYECDTSHDWWDYYKYAARQLSGFTYEKESSIIDDLLSQNMRGTSIQGGVAVKKAIKEIEQLREYDIEKGKPDWHGRRHINNVVLYSYLMSQYEGKLSGENMDVLLQAAKYHDVGRDGVWNGLGEGKRHDEDLVPHAYPSALAAEFYMKREKNPDGSRKYTDAQIAMTKVAIEYHEVHEKDKNKFNKEVFGYLCEKEHVRPEDYQVAKLMCIYLKDADALDRTRFMYKTDEARNHEWYADGLDMRYLRTDIAVALRDYARSINNKHYVNRSDNLYIPQELDKYTAPNVSTSESWSERKNKIRKFMSSRSINFDPSHPSTIQKEDIQMIINVPQEKRSLFCRARLAFRKHIEERRKRRDTKNKDKKDNNGYVPNNVSSNNCKNNGKYIEDDYDF